MSGWIRDKVVDSADSVSAQFANTDFINEGIDGLTGALADFEEGSANRTLPSGCTVKENDPYCVPCTVCTSISAKVGTAKQQIVDNAGSGVAALKDVRTSVNEQTGNLDGFIVTINSTRDSVDDAHEQYDKQKSAQQTGVLVLFALALLVIVLGLVGILFGVTPLKFLANIIHIAYVIGFVALTLTFLVSAIFLAISVLLGDACEVSMIFTSDWSVVASGQNGDIANACFQNESLIDVLDLSSQLDFARGGIEFPESIDTDSLLDFSDLDTFATTIQSVDSSTFQVDAAELKKGLDALNAFTKQTCSACNPSDCNYNEGNILTPWSANDNLHPTTDDGFTYMIERYTMYENMCPATGSPGLPFECEDANPCTFQAFIGETYKKVSTLVAVKVDGAAFVTELKQNMTKVTSYTDTFKTKTKDLNDKVNVIKDDLESSLIKYVGEFESEMYCTFIMNGFFEIYNALCGTSCRRSR